MSKLFGYIEILPFKEHSFIQCTYKQDIRKILDWMFRDIDAIQEAPNEK